MIIIENPNPIYKWEHIQEDVLNDNEVSIIENYTIKHQDNFKDGIVYDKDQGLNKTTRSTKIMWLDDINEYSDVFQKISSHIHHLNNNIFRYSISVMEFPQYAIYDSEAEGHYDWHYDTMLRNPGNMLRKLSYSIGLNDDYEGGELEFFSPSGDIKYKTSKGQMIIFPSFIPHKVHPVTKGTRKSLVGWAHGPNFV